jgi:hypothetical protein
MFLAASACSFDFPPEFSTRMTPTGHASRMIASANAAT